MDTEPVLLMNHFSISSTCCETVLESLPDQYHSAVVTNKICLVYHRLTFYELFLTISDRSCRIVVPVSLRYAIVSLLHGSLNVGRVEGV